MSQSQTALSSTALAPTTRLPNHLADLFLWQVARHGESTCMAQRIPAEQRTGNQETDGTGWKYFSWLDLAKIATALQQQLRQAGAKPGDRILLLANNSPLWLAAELAILLHDCTVVPAYTNVRPADYQHICKTAAVKFAFVDEALDSKLLDQIPQLIKIKLSSAHPSGPEAKSSDIASPRTAYSHASADSAVPGKATGKKKTTAYPALIIFTSGTSGNPRGVVLSHQAIIANAWSARKALIGSSLQQPEPHRFFSFLPLAHSYEHIAGLWWPIVLGAEIYYPESLASLLPDLAAAQPTMVTTVPRFLETVRAVMLQRMTKASKLRQQLLATALDLANRRYHGKPFSIAASIKFAIIRKLLHRTASKRFGGRIKAFIVGGAPIHPEIEKLFIALKIYVLPGFGLTESAPVVAVNLPEQFRFASVGLPLPDVKVKLGPDNEILVAGPQLMDGYINEPEASKEKLAGGWLHTGDIGTIDADGFLSIVERKKDIIVTSGGKNIAPQQIELNLELELEIMQAMVFGDAKPHLVALLVPNPELAPDKRAIAAAVRRANLRLANFQAVKAYIIEHKPFSVEAGSMTPTRKIRRKLITEKYRTQLLGLYGKKRK